MATIAVDTHEVITQLQASGFTKQQAEALVSAAKKVDLSGFATKADLNDAVHTLQIAMRDQAFTIVKWMTGMLLAQGALIVGLIELLK
jgi:hypothetical protein